MQSTFRGRLLGRSLWEMTQSWSEKEGEKRHCGRREQCVSKSLLEIKTMKWTQSLEGGMPANQLSSPTSSNTEGASQDLKITTENLLMIQKWRENNLLNSFNKYATIVFLNTSHFVSLFLKASSVLQLDENKIQTSYCGFQVHTWSVLCLPLSLLLAITYPLRPLSVPRACQASSC